jgi:opacity protein-like surface antigen
MARTFAITLASAALLVVGSAAYGADLLPQAPSLEPLPPATPELNGWYLRGDIGMATNAEDIGLKNTPDPIAMGLADGYLSTGANAAFNSTTLSSAEFVDVGLGYQFNPWLRGDVTFEYRDGAQFQSTYNINNPGAFGSATTPTQFTDFYRANLSSAIAMANVYADLGTWNGLTPYIGGGLGVANNRLYGMTDQGVQNYTVSQTNSFTGSSGGYFSNGSETNLAWALMAGLDFKIAENVKLELGYRFLDYGKITSGGSNCINGHGAGSGFGAGSCGGQVTNYVSSTSNLASNDFHIGLIWYLEPTPLAPAPAPLVRKY